MKRHVFFLLLAIANTGYIFGHWTKNGEVASTESSFTFNAMANDSYAANFKTIESHGITLVQAEHGTITASQTTAQPGDVITITATPDTDCIFSTWYVFMTGDTRTVVTIINDQFTMPDYDVTVMAIFKTIEVEEVTIGSGTSTSNVLPTYNSYKYSLTQQIYTAEEVGTAGIITHIAFKASSNADVRNLDIYMKPTNLTAFKSTTGWETMGPINKVFSGSVDFNASGWTTIELTTPFEYDGIKNLNLCVVDNTGSYCSSANTAMNFYTYSTGANRAMRAYTNNLTYAVGYSNAISGYTGTYITSNNQVVFTMAVKSSAESLTASPNVIDDLTYEEGNGPSSIHKLDLVGVDLQNDITLTAPENFEICATEDGAYGKTLAIARDGTKSRTVTSWDFEGSFLNWTTIDNDGDGYNWVVTTDLLSTFENGHSGTDALSSQSYSSSTGALTPDNWLVSPQVTLGGTFSMWACAQDASWPAEHFGIYVSTTSATDVSSFTLLNEWTLSAKGGGKADDGTRGTRAMGDWYQFSVDLSAYTNQNGYLAVRHYNCTDMFYINVDDFKLDTKAGFTPNLPVVITPATVFVRMEGGLETGNYSGTLTANVSGITSNVTLNGQVTMPIVEQNITLVQGWNWFVPTVGMTLADLEAALGTNGVSINTQEQNVTYEEGEWLGDNIILTPGHMYKIQVSADCNFTLSGTPASNVSINIEPGYNWFGYTGTEETSIDQILSNNGFLPVEGDAIITGNQNTTFEEGEWLGDFETLIPGKGYIYVSQDTESKTLTF